MNYSVHPSNRIKKKIKKLKKSSDVRTIHAFEEAVDLLSVFNAPARFVLRENWSDHQLKGRLSDFRELHLGFDQLLIYRLYEEEKAIDLIDIISHDELKKWRS